MQSGTSSTSSSNGPGELSKELHERIYYFMKLTRLVEDRLGVLAAQGKVLGSLYTSLGQEATAVGCAAALDAARGDVVAPLLRDMGAMLTMGASPVEIFQQYMAKDGPSKGRELNIHFGSPARSFVGPVSMLGEMIPVMAGIALSFKIKASQSVALTFIGDGGASTGPTHEGLNFAAVLDLPLILVVENNGFAYSTPTDQQSRLKRLADRALAYGMPGVTVDGNDVLAVYHATSEAVDRARSGNGPTLIEAVTFRMRGHAQHDNQAYVPSKLLAEWKEKDPIARHERHVTANGILTHEELASIESRIAQRIEQAVQSAEATPFPAAQSAANDVFDGSQAVHSPWLQGLT